MSKIRKLISREKIVNSLKRFGVLRIKVTHVALLQYSILLLILILAFSIRLLPMRWGYYISEFDPYWQYRLAKDITQNGFLHWTTWQDTMSWWPWGKDVAHTSFPGLPLTIAALYTVFSALGVPMVPAFSTFPLASDPVYNLAVIFPVIMGTLTCLAFYFLGKDIGGKETGLFAAFLLAINASYVGRTSLGFCDDETIGIFSLILFSFFFLRSIEKERSTRSNLLYAIAAGLSLGYMMSSWGAARYAIGLPLLFVVVLLLLRRYSSRLFVSYTTTFSVALFIAINVPYLGFRFLTEITNLAVFGVFLLLCAFEISRHIQTAKMKSLFAVGLVALGIAAFVALSLYGYVQPLQAKYIAILNPFERLSTPAVVSVQEHRPASWGSIYYDVGIGILFIPIGFYFAAQNPTNRNIYLILWGLTSIYFASALVRLTLILAPALCLLWALALTRILKPFITLLREAPVTVVRKLRFERAHVGREFSAAVLILIFLLLTFALVLPSRESSLGHPRIFDQAYVPTTIAAASLSLRPGETMPDWIDALTWMRYNLKQDDVVASWWDYGYWITIIANKTSLADNGTLNSTQMRRIGLMFMSNEDEALEILEEFNQQAQNRKETTGDKSLPNKVTYVVAFVTFYGEGVQGANPGDDANYGDEGKWTWMANIAFNNLDAWKTFGNSSLGKDGIDTNGDGSPDSFPANPKGQNTTLYKLMMWGKKQRVPTIQAVKPQYFDLVYYSQKGQSPVVTAGGVNALVVVYKVVYP